MPDSPIPPARYANGRFGPGNPGRRAGARHRISHRTAMAILEDFEIHKDQALDRMRRYHTQAYMALITRMVERELEVETSSFEDVSDPEAARMVCVALTALNAADSPRAALLHLDRVLLSEAAVDPTPAAAVSTVINGD
jgi:hypothetical protein